MKKWSECLLHLPWFSSWSVCQRRSWKPTCLGIFARFLNTTVYLRSEKFDDQLCCIYSIFSLVLSVQQCRNWVNDGIFSVNATSDQNVKLCSVWCLYMQHLPESVCPPEEPFPGDPWCCSKHFGEDHRNAWASVPSLSAQWDAGGLSEGVSGKI